MTVETMEKATKDIEPRPRQEMTGAEATRPGPVFLPEVDIFESDEAITVLADMPGVKADGLSINLEDSVLTIDGRVAEVDTGNEQVLLREYETGAFHREFRLTNLIAQDRIKASLRDGVLQLVLPKAEAARPRKIEVQAG